MFNVNYNTREEGEIKINTLIWTLPSFIEIIGDKNLRELRTKPEVENSDLRYHLKMQFLGKNNDIAEVYYMSPNNSFLKVVLTIVVKRFEENSLVIKDYHTVPSNKWQYLCTLSKRDIIGRDSFLLIDGSLKLKFEFMVTNNVNVGTQKVPAAQLSNDFESLFKDSLFTDLVIKSVDGDEFKVHKAVLASRSSMLKAHFEKNIEECATNCITSPLQTEVLREVLTYVYSNKAPRVDEMPEKLLSAASYYQLSRLRKICEESLQKRLTVDNAIETLQLAEHHAANSLITSTLEFIRDGQEKLITKSEGWIQMQNVELIKKIYEFVVTEPTDDLK